MPKHDTKNKHLTYRDFLDRLINGVNDHPLLKRVFTDYNPGEDKSNDFPILSLLQHYGGATSLVDWTYCLDVALYFATEYIKGKHTGHEINDYFSIYRINNEKLGIKGFDYDGPIGALSLREKRRSSSVRSIQADRFYRGT